MTWTFEIEVIPFKGMNKVSHIFVLKMPSGSQELPLTFTLQEVLFTAKVTEVPVSEVTIIM
jgi:hypothetical protein